MSISDQSNQAAAIPFYEAPSPVPTYRVQIADITPAALATDVLTLTGSATKKVTIKRIQITADAAAASVIDFYVRRRAAADTAGTSTAPAILKNDSTNPSATAVAALYSANPTINDAGIVAAADHYALPAAATTGYPCVPWIEDFGKGAQGLILNGVAEQLCIGFNGQVIPSGMAFYAIVEWTEQ